MDNRNLILAIVLSVAILLVFELYFGKRQPPPPVQRQAEPAQPSVAPPVPPAPGQRADVATAPAAPAVAPSPERDRQAAVDGGLRVKIESARLHGSIALAGGRLDDLTLADYRETVDRNSPEIVLLSAAGSANAYFAEFGWVGPPGVKVPGPDTRWRADRPTLGPENPVTLRWDNGAGLRFTHTYALDRDYMFTVTQRVDNAGAEPVALHPYGLIARRGTPTVTGFFILHEGLLGVLDGTLKEIDYDELQEKRAIEQRTTGGWIGITDKYWLTALIPDQRTESQARFVHRKDDADRYQVDFLAPQQVAAGGGAAETTGRLFAGAKEVVLLDRYADELGIRRFDLAIDFGWFYFLTKPIFYILIYLNQYVGNFGVAILLLTVMIKLVFFPLANKSYKAMSKMKKLQPEMLKLRERFGEDRTRLNQEMMALYKREKANPASGCLPIIIQIPVFFALYKVLFVTIEMRQAPFYGWIKDLSQADPTTLFNLFGLIPWTPPEFLIVGVWPLIMGATMFLQQRLNPQPADPIQAKVFLFLPVVFTFMLAPFPAGLVIYWAWNNVLSVLQQWVIMKRMGVSV